MRRTRKDTAAIQAITSDVNKELCVDNTTALAKTIEEIISKHFKEADEKSEARINRLEKRLDNMYGTLSRHTEDIKTLHLDATQLQQPISETETQLQSLSRKIMEMEDRSRRDNLLILNLKEGVEGSNVLSYLTENVQRWFPTSARSVSGSLANTGRIGLAQRHGGPLQIHACARLSSSSCTTQTETSC